MKKANPTVIGTFVVGAVALAVGGLMLFGSGPLFRNAHTFVAYFDQSMVFFWLNLAVIGSMWSITCSTRSSRVASSAATRSCCIRCSRKVSWGASAAISSSTPAAIASVRRRSSASPLVQTQRNGPNP